MDKKFYITTTLPYVNSKPHLGFALEIIQADVIARYKRLLGYEVFFNFGTDEHGQKIYQKALEGGRNPQEYVDEYAKKFDGLKTALNLSYNNFIRTTDPHHIKAAQEMWRRCLKNGFIEKGIYKAKYCVGCELEKQDSELIDGRCPIHPNLKIEFIKEDNYFFKLSKFQKRLLELYKKYSDFVVPEHRQKEITNFVTAGLQDFSISRLKDKMPWGIPVAEDERQVQFVWFDALTNYISALGWPEDEKKFKDYWGTAESPKALQVAGKDNLRQQSAMWQAMLMAAGLPTSRQIFIHGFITSEGQKMSKSLGNVIDPIEYVERYGTDALRYYLLAKISPTEDGDFTREKFEETYNADLANGLGNLVSRVAALVEQKKLDVNKLIERKTNRIFEEIDPLISKYRFDEALKYIWGCISGLDAYINRSRPWQLDLSEANKSLSEIVIGSESLISLFEIVEALKIFLPETAEKIEKRFKGSGTKSETLLFPRLG